MFTTGSKLFLGATALSIVGAVVFGATIGGPAGVLGTIGLVSLAVVFAFLAGINFFTRDGNVGGDGAGRRAHRRPPRSRRSGRSMWPLVGAVGVGGLVVGAVSRPVVFKVSLIVVLAVGGRVDGPGLERAGQRRSPPTTRASASACCTRSSSPSSVRSSALRRSSTRSRASCCTSARTPAAGCSSSSAPSSPPSASCSPPSAASSKGTAAGIVAVGALALVGVGVASAVVGPAHHRAAPRDHAPPCAWAPPPRPRSRRSTTKASQDVCGEEQRHRQRRSSPRTVDLVRVQHRHRRHASTTRSPCRAAPPCTCCSQRERRRRAVSPCTSARSRRPTAPPAASRPTAPRHQPGRRGLPHLQARQVASSPAPPPTASPCPVWRVKRSSCWCPDHGPE